MRKQQGSLLEPPRARQRCSAGSLRAGKQAITAALLSGSVRQARARPTLGSPEDA